MRPGLGFFVLVLASTRGFASCDFVMPALMPGVTYYSNATEEGDTIDPELFAEHQAQMKPLEDFMLSVSDALDQPIAWSDAPRITRQCVLQVLVQAARRGALLQPPTNSGSRVGRVHYSVALQIIAAKLHFRGLVVPPIVVQWLNQLTRANIRDYRNFRFHGEYNNVNAWTGAGAALQLALARYLTPSNPIDTYIAEYEEQAWNLGLRGIAASGANSGWPVGELFRGKNSLIYSLHYYSALLIHREARRVRGIADKQPEWVKLRLFASTFGQTFCGSSSAFFERVRVNWDTATQESHKASLSGYAFRVILSGLLEGTVLNDMFSACPGRPVPNGYSERKLGGDTRYIKTSIRALAQ